MNRRHYLGLVSSGALTITGGCLSASRRIGDELRKDQEKLEESDINHSIDGSGNLKIDYPTPTTHADIFQNGEKVTTIQTELTSFEIPLPSCSGEKSQVEPGDITIKLVNEKNTIGEYSWEYDPQLEVPTFEISSVNTYDPLGYPQESTPVFTVNHIGEGATCIESVQISNPQTEIDTADGEKTPVMRTGTFDATEKSDLNPYEATFGTDWGVSSNSPSKVAIDGLFTYDATKEGNSPPVETNEIEQTFDMTINTVTGRQHTTEVQVLMTNGIVESDVEVHPWTHRFSTVRLLNTT